MKANDFVSGLADMLGEDFTYASLWTRSELLDYLRKTLVRFSQLTQLVDKDSIRYVSSTTGEASVPKEFTSGYYVLYNKRQVDLVTFGELDFISSDWLTGSTGAIPYGATIMGSGGTATVRVVPVPTDTDSGAVVNSIVLHDSSSVYWTVGVDTNGALTTTSSVSGTTSEPVMIHSSTKYWLLDVDTSGVLSTTEVAGIPMPILDEAGNPVLDEAGNIIYDEGSGGTEGETTKVEAVDSSGVKWFVRIDDDGVITTHAGGRLVMLEIDSVKQDFTSNYGTTTNAHAAGTTTTPDFVVRLDNPYGIVTSAKTSEGTLHLWYKGVIRDTPTTESDIYLNGCYLPIIQHGTLALAYEHDGPGQDKQKAKLLESIFKIECESVRRLFNRK